MFQGTAPQPTQSQQPTQQQGGQRTPEDELMSPVQPRRLQFTIEDLAMHQKWTWGSRCCQDHVLLKTI